MPTTLQDIANESGVDISTVSRALRDDPRVRENTRNKINELAHQMGYRPNLTARNLAAGSTRTVWLLLPSLPFQIESELAQYAGPLMREHGYDLLIALFHSKKDVFTHLLNRLNQGVADGAIIMPNMDTSTPEIDRLVQSNFPMVFIDRYIKNLPIPVVTTDQLNCSKELVKNCIEQKVEGFIILFPNNNEVVRKRHKGAIDAVLKSKLPYTNANHLDNIEISKLKNCQSIGIIANDSYAIRKIIQKETKNLNKHKLIFACFDTWHGDAYPSKSVTVCHQDFRSMANIAVKEILKQVERKSLPSRRQTFKVPAEKYETIVPSLS